MTPTCDHEQLLQQVRSEYLHRMTAGNGTLLRQVERYVTSRSGKMLRPRLLLLAAATLGEDHLLSRRTLLLAVCVEMLHNASLLHDDVIDHAKSRRGQPSVNALYNSATAVLVGDYHFTQIMQLLDEVGDKEATRKVNAVVMSMVEAELLQQEVGSGQWVVGSTREQQNQALPTTHYPLPTKDTYLRIIDGKTANLFALAAELGNPDYRDYGFHYGRLFQLRDDLADGEAMADTERLIASEEDAIKHLPHVLNL